MTHQQIYNDLVFFEQHGHWLDGVIPDWVAIAAKHVGLDNVPMWGWKYCADGFFQDLERLKHRLQECLEA